MSGDRRRGVAVSTLSGAVAPRIAYTAGCRRYGRVSSATGYEVRLRSAIPPADSGNPTFDRSNADLADANSRPPLATQQAIADYLDRETARIDALIAAKRQMVGAVGGAIDRQMVRLCELEAVPDAPDAAARQWLDCIRGGVQVAASRW